MSVYLGRLGNKNCRLRSYVSREIQFANSVREQDRSRIANPSRKWQMGRACPEWLSSPINVPSRRRLGSGICKTQLQADLELAPATMFLRERSRSFDPGNRVTALATERSSRRRLNLRKDESGARLLACWPTLHRTNGWWAEVDGMAVVGANGAYGN